MNNRELMELIEKLKKASPREIGFIFDKMGERSPFEDPKNRLLLPSRVKEDAIRQIEKWFRDGKLTAKKNG